MSSTAVTGRPPSSLRAASPNKATESRVRRSKIAIVVLIVAGVVVLAIPLATTIMSGKAPFRAISESYPGLAVTIPTTVFQAVADASSIVVFGALLTVLGLRDATPRQAQFLEEGFERRILRWASTLWALSSLGMVVFTPFDSQGQPLSRLFVSGAYSYLYQAGYFPVAWTFTFAAALIVCAGAWFANRWTGLLIPMWTTLIGTLAPVIVGQLLVGPNHDFGSDAGIMQTLAAGAGIGVVSVAALRVASGRLLSLLAMRRMFVIVAVCLPLMFACDLVIYWFEVGGESPFGSITGWQLFARTVVAVLLLALAVMTWQAWRRGKLTAGRILALFTGAAFVIACWSGLGSAMTRIPPPVFFIPTSISQVFMGFNVPDAPSAIVMLTQWRPNLLLIALSMTAVTIYLVAVHVLHKRGDRWPMGRTMCWIVGWTVVVIATSSGFGKYSAADFGIHMIVHMALNMLAPGFLVLGGVVTLLLRASQARTSPAAGVHDWITWMLHWRVLRFCYNPLIVFMVFIGSYYGLYLTTGLFGNFMRFHWAHQFMNFHFLIIGYLYYSIVVGVDRPPRPLPHIGKLGYVLAAMPFHAFFGIILMTAAVPVGQLFYQYLGLPWANLQASEYLGGGVAWAGGEIPLMIIIVVLAVQWARQDEKEAIRKDRHIDAGQDDEFDAYNRMLARISERQELGPSSRALGHHAPGPESDPSAGSAGAPAADQTFGPDPTPVSVNRVEPGSSVASSPWPFDQAPASAAPADPQESRP